MNNNIKVSLIIPNYNNSKYLKECVESAINQTYPLNEIIIVDDKSTDNSVKIIKELCEKHKTVRLIELKENKGVSNARNIGLHASQSEYVTFMDADDYYYSKTKIEKEVALIKKYLDKNIDILSYSIVVYGLNTGEIKKDIINFHKPKYQFIEGKALFQLLSLGKQLRIPRDYIIKKEILIKAGCYSFYKNFYEDLDLLFRISALKVPFYCTFSEGTLYRDSLKGLSKRDKRDTKETIEEIVSCYSHNLNFADRIKIKIMKNIYRIINGIDRRIYR